jgi:hypothetical protein
MALLTWKNVFFSKISDTLVKSLLHQIELERLGETIDASMIKAVIDSLGTSKFCKFRLYEILFIFRDMKI